MDPNIINTSIRYLRAQPGIECEFMAVLASYVENMSSTGMHYTVYIGLVKPGSHRTRASRLRAAQWVVVHGHKCRYKEATVYFPAIKQEAYVS